MISQSFSDSESLRRLQGPSSSSLNHSMRVKQSSISTSAVLIRILLTRVNEKSLTYIRIKKSILVVLEPLIRTTKVFLLFTQSYLHPKTRYKTLCLILKVLIRPENGSISVPYFWEILIYTLCGSYKVLISKRTILMF